MEIYQNIINDFDEGKLDAIIEIVSSSPTSTNIMSHFPDAYVTHLESIHHAYKKKLTLFRTTSVHYISNQRVYFVYCEPTYGLPTQAQFQYYNIENDCVEILKDTINTRLFGLKLGIEAVLDIFPREKKIGMLKPFFSDVYKKEWENIYKQQVNKAKREKKYIPEKEPWLIPYNALLEAIPDAHIIKIYES